MPVPSKELVQKSFALIRHLTIEHGPEKGNAAWEGLCDALDDGGDLKMAIFKLMMTGEIPRTSIAFKSWDKDVSDRKVGAIKWARQVCGYGLKESKELIEGIDIRDPNYRQNSSFVQPIIWEIARHHFKNEEGEDCIPNYNIWSIQASDLGLDVEFI